MHQASSPIRTTTWNDLYGYTWLSYEEKKRGGEKKEEGSPVFFFFKYMDIQQLVRHFDFYKTRLEVTRGRECNSIRRIPFFIGFAWPAEPIPSLVWRVIYRTLIVWTQYVNFKNNGLHNSHQTKFSMNCYREIKLFYRRVYKILICPFNIDNIRFRLGNIPSRYNNYGYTRNLLCITYPLVNVSLRLFFSSAIPIGILCQPIMERKETIRDVEWRRKCLNFGRKNTRIYLILNDEDLYWKIARVLISGESSIYREQIYKQKLSIVPTDPKRQTLSAVFGLNIVASKQRLK